MAKTKATKPAEQPAVVEAIPPPVKSSQNELSKLFGGNLETRVPERTVPENVIEHQAEPEPVANPAKADEPFSEAELEVETTAISGMYKPKNAPEAEVANDKQPLAPAKTEEAAIVPDVKTLTEAESLALTDDRKIMVDGVETTFGEYKKGNTYADLQKAKWKETDALKKLEAVEAENKALKEMLEVSQKTVGSVFQDPFGKAYTALKMAGATEEEALAGASAATGKSIRPIDQVEAGTPKEGSEDWYARDYEELGLDPNPQGPAYNKWVDHFINHPAALAVKEVKAENARFKAELAAEEQSKEAARKAQADRDRTMTARQQQQKVDNKETYDVVLPAMLSALGLDHSKMTVDQVNMVDDAVAEAAKSFGVDLTSNAYVSTNPVTAAQIKRAVTTMNLDMSVFKRPTAQLPSGQLPTPEALQQNGQRKIEHRPIGAGGASSSGGGSLTPTAAPMRPMDARTATKSSLENMLLKKV